LVAAFAGFLASEVGGSEASQFITEGKKSSGLLGGLGTVDVSLGSPIRPL
jgi:hypothetical protein